MFTMVRVAPNRLDLEISGKLDRTEMEALLDAFVEKSAGIEHGVSLYRVRDFDLPTLGAIAVELARLPELLRVVRRFDKAAVVADAAWVRRVSELEGALFPGLTIRGFEPERAADADAWLARD